MDYKEIIDGLDETSISALYNEPMSKHTTFKIGGNADVFLTVNTENVLIELLHRLNKENIPFYIFGNGSNVLVRDEGIRGVVIKLDGDFKKINLSSKNEISCGSAVTLTRLCLYAEKSTLSGIEFLFGIPGTVGGAVFMNAGAYNGEIKDVLSSCSYVTKDGEKATLSNDKLDFSYRHSRFSSTDDIITKAVFKLKPGEKACIRDRMDDLMDKRREKQPLDYPNAGSIFKRPVGNFAGALIEKAGLRGKSIGGAAVSEKHCGFIVNKGNATCEDVLNLIDLITAKVFAETGIILENEVKVIGG